MKINDIIMIMAAVIFFGGCGVLAFQSTPDTERVVYTLTIYEGMDENGEYLRAVSQFAPAVSADDRCEIIRMGAHDSRQYYGPECLEK